MLIEIPKIGPRAHQLLEQFYDVTFDTPFF